MFQKRSYYIKQVGKLFVLTGMILFLSVCTPSKKRDSGVAPRMDTYNVVWNSPSTDASGVMPLGNGDIAAGVYAIEDGDLYLLLAKNDAYTFAGDIFKTGRVRVSLNPNPFEKGKPFKQILDLKTGSVRIEAGNVSLLIWADANRPVYHVEVEGDEEISVEVSADLWDRYLISKWNNFDASGETLQLDPESEPVQDVVVNRNGNILWYYAVGDRSVFDADMRYYDVEELIGKYPDPYKYNTFGNLLESPDLELNEGVLAGKGKNFDIRIHALTKKAPDARQWIEAIEQQASEPIEKENDWEAHCRWWSGFWNRSWIFVSRNDLPEEDREQFNGEGYITKRTEKDGGALVSQSYHVFRYLMACQSRGMVQAKFNGGLFTQQLRVTDDNQRGFPGRELPDGRVLSHEDDRDWGRRFTFQNQRLLYWPLLMSGDYDLLLPFFDYYRDLLPVRMAITQAWFGHEGAYYRENIEPTGAERDCGRDGKPPKTKPGENKGDGYYHSYYFTSGLEITAMMIDYLKRTGDADFQVEILVPFAREVLLFFDKHYLRDEHGEFRLDPAMVLETWWVAVNPAPDVAGLQYCLDELLKMGAGTEKDQSAWKRFRSEIPPVHLHEIEGRKAIAPAKEWSVKRNAENGELYPVFPFELFGLGHGTEDIVEWTMKHRSHKNSFDFKCWTQDQIHWAYAGNAKAAAEGLVNRFRHASASCRFPLYGSRGPDSCPDLDHFGSGSTALQRMLVQEAEGKILLLPAWPANWDVDFKLHLYDGAVISGSVKEGRLTDWNIVPESRKDDVVVCQSRD